VSASPRRGQGEEPSASHRVGPWVPVIPVELVPVLAGGDIDAARELGAGVQVGEVGEARRDRRWPSSAPRPRSARLDAGAIAAGLGARELRAGVELGEGSTAGLEPGQGRRSGSSSAIPEILPPDFSTSRDEAYLRG
jgi:hypothetical protein